MPFVSRALLNRLGAPPSQWGATLMAWHVKCCIHTSFLARDVLVPTGGNVVKSWLIAMPYKRWREAAGLVCNLLPRLCFMVEVAWKEALLLNASANTSLTGRIRGDVPGYVGITYGGIPTSPVGVAYRFLHAGNDGDRCGLSFYLSGLCGVFISFESLFTKSQ